MLVLGKPIGVGIYSAALKKEQLSAEGYAAMIASTTQLNTPGHRAGPDARRPRADRRHRLRPARPPARDLPRLRRRRDASTSRGCRCTRTCCELARDGFFTGASGRNWAGYGKDVALPDGFESAKQALLTDPQTSGGLLVACAPDAVDGVLATFRADGFDRAAVIGDVAAGIPRVVVR